MCGKKWQIFGVLLTTVFLGLWVAPAAAKSKAKHLDQLSCKAGEVVVFNGKHWVCADGVDTSTASKCAAWEVLLVNGSCADIGGLIPPTERFVDNGDGTLTDIKTGLMWEKKNSDDGVQDFSNPHDVDNLYTWTSTADNDLTNGDGTAFTDFLSRLNQQATDDPDSTCFANHCDWRIPRLAELRSILVEQFPCAATPCIDPMFGLTEATNYWSHTYVPANPSVGWCVNFLNGFVNNVDKFDAVYVRAVRGGK
jgi:hypothetical protein